MKAKRLILHIGHGKTGSTSIQRCLRASSEALSQAGVLFPDPGRHDNHQLIFPHVHGVLPDDPVQMASLAPTSAKAYENAAHLWTALKGEISEQKPETIVLSCENQFRPFGPDAMAQLRARCAEIAETTEVIAYLRDPASYFLSWMQQEVKKRAEFRAPSQSFYRDTLEPFETAGPGPLTARLFAKNALIGGDVVQDFFATTLPKIDVVDLDRGEAEANTSISPEGMAVLQDVFRGTHPLPAALGDDRKAFRKALVATDSDIPGFTRPSLFKDRHAVVEARATDLQWLNATLGVRFPYTEQIAMTPEEAQKAFSGWVNVEDFCAVDADRKQRLFDASVAKAHTAMSPLKRLARRFGF